MKNRIYGITTWSNKVFTARKNYTCNTCGETIPIGVPYLRHVIRHGETAGKDPLVNHHLHQSCEAPWFQVDTKNRCGNLGRLKQPKVRADALLPQVAFFQPGVFIHSRVTGSLSWTPPPVFIQRLVQHPKQPTAIATMSEIAQALNIVIAAALEASGNPRKALAFSHLLTQIAESLSVPESGRDQEI